MFLNRQISADIIPRNGYFVIFKRCVMDSFGDRGRKEKLCKDPESGGQLGPLFVPASKSRVR